MTELTVWTVDDVAEFAGITPRSADTELRRQGVRPVGRQPGRGGKNLYDAAEVRAALAGRARGVRSNPDGERTNEPGRPRGDSS